MKIIDLLNKIANGEEVKAFKYDGYIFKYDIDSKLWENEKGAIFSTYCYIEECLNDEIEIIEEKEMCHKCHKYPAEYNQTYCEFCLGISKEEKKIPEKLGLTAYVDGEISYSWSKSEAVLKTKINEIIDYIKSKGE